MSFVATSAQTKSLTTTPVKMTRFVSMNLCIDRLLLALTSPDQVAALTSVSFDPMMNLQQPAEQITKIQGTIESLLPYRNDVILINPLYQGRLYQRLQDLGFHTIAIELPQNKDQLLILIKKIALLTGQWQKQHQLEMLLNKSFPAMNRQVLTLEEGLTVRNGVNNQELYHLTGLTDMSSNLKLSRKHSLSFESLLMTNLDLLLIAQGGSGFSKTTSYFYHPALQQKLKQSDTLSLPTKYQICFDQGIWLGAQILEEQGHNRKK